MNPFPNLFEPIKVGQVQLKNRLVMLPVSTNYGSDGRVTSRLIDFYVERARGGAGLICFGFMPPFDLRGAKAVGILIHGDEVIPELRKLTEAIHAQGAKVLAQLCLRHDWRASATSPLEPVAPTAGIVTGPSIRPPRELSVEEIGQIVQQFGDAARRAREAGFDMVEFHAGLGYLINRFISPATNKRQDGYGGSLENRLRFLREIIRCAKQKAGADYTFGCRLSAQEYIPGGHTLEDSKQVARMLEMAGLDFINVQGGFLESPQPFIQSSVPPGAYVFLAEGIKKAVKLPVIAAYRINTPALAEQVLSEGRADMVGMCRALIADPHFPNKARKGRVDDICPCIACCDCLDEQYVRGRPMVCSVNPRLGEEGQPDVERASRPKRVSVIGGGPAGMQAAIVASQRGHRVTLFEESDTLGGQLLPASIPPHKVEIAALRDYLVRQLRKEKVNVLLNTEATPERVMAGKPDAVVLATGAVPVIPDIPGIENGNVANPVDVLMGKVRVGQRVVVVGGGLIGCETAEFLAKQGKQVTITSRQEKVGHDIGPSTKWVMRKRLQEAGVITKAERTAVAITGKGVWLQHGEEREFVEADTIIVSGGMRSRDGLAQALKPQVAGIYQVGDCSEPGRIRQAIKDGARIGSEL